MTFKNNDPKGCAITAYLMQVNEIQKEKINKRKFWEKKHKVWITFINAWYINQDHFAN